jgi:O-antigen/teichoic acid export membrane protein
MPEPANDSSRQASESRGEFFRHSGWMMIAGIAGGALAWGVHFLARKMPAADYGLFGALMAATMCVPGTPIQMAFTHQAASALASGREAQLAGLIRAFCGGAFVLWAVFAAVVVVFRREIMFRWEVTDATALWIMLPFLLITMLMPVFSGLLQGRQNFLWLGWTGIISFGIRFGVAALAVLALGAGVSGLMSGVLAGGVIALGLALWQTGETWRTPPRPSDWRAVLKETFPLMIGFAAFQFLFSADVLFAKAYFGKEEVGFYNSAGTLSRALMWAVGPLSTVMFPKLVRSHARSENTGLMGVVLAGTAVLSITGAVCLSLVGPWVVQFVFGAQYVRLASHVLPWYAAAMVPLTLANVLLNNLLAKNDHRIIPVLPVIALLYVLGMTQLHGSMVRLLQAFGVSNLLLLGACAWFSSRPKPLSPSARPAA